MSQQYDYDAIIIGAGPSGAFCAYELVNNRPDLRILMIEKGRPIERRRCPKRTTGACAHCQPCSITTGFSGAGAFSDGKLSLSPDVGGNLPEILGYDETQRLMRDSDQVYLDFGADTHVWGLDQPDKVRQIRRRAIDANLKLIDCPIRHLGTEEGYKIYQRMQGYLLERGVEMRFNTSVADLDIEGGRLRAVITDKGERLAAPEVIAAVGRDGAEWFSRMCIEHGIDAESGQVDVGVRVELRDEVLDEINRAVYEAKLVYYTPTFDDRVRTFCTNPSGEVATEYYDDGLAVVNGHAYKDDALKTSNTNFALLVSKTFTEPFHQPIEYGKHIAQLSNMLSDGRILVQTYGDLRRGRRTTAKRLMRNNVIPTLKDAAPGDLSLALPHRIMVDLIEMIEALDEVAPGVASAETLLYGVEVKFYSNKVLVDRDFHTNIAGLRAIGDGASVTRGLQQASANGLAVARSILADR